MRRTLFLILIPLGFLILTGGTTLPSDPESEGQDSVVTTSDKIKAARLNIKLISTNPVQEAVEWYNDRFFQTNFEAKVQRVQRDRIGYTHIRLKQYYKGIPIDGTDVIVHINKDTVIYWVTGDMLRELDMDVEPTLSATEAERIAVEDAVNTRCIGSECNETRNATPDEVDLYYDVSLDRPRGIRTIGTAQLLIYGGSLAYKLVVSEKSLDHAAWEYLIDAARGDMIRRRNLIMYNNNPPSDNGYDTTMVGYKLSREIDPVSMDSTVSMTGWRDTVGEQDYFLYYKGDDASGKAPWGVFDLNHHGSDTTDSLCDWERRDAFDWGTSDKFAVSVAKNLECVQNWFTDTLGRHGADDSGGLLKAHVHWGQDYNNAMFSPADTSLYFGCGDGITNDPLGVLEIVGHESGHAITFFTSYLHYSSREHGGLNESYSDIAGAAVEFAFQADCTSAYPSSVPGRADWLVGEDDLIGHEALRDFRYAQRVEEGGQLDEIKDTVATYYDGTNFWEDSNGVAISTNPHITAGVQNFAFYLLAEGSDTVRQNDGHSYGAFDGIGIAEATRVAMRANICYLVEYSTSADARQAWLLAAQDLVDLSLIPGTAVAVVESVWVAVGVVPQLRCRRGGYPYLQMSSLAGAKIATTLGDQMHKSYAKEPGNLRFWHQSNDNGAGLRVNAFSLTCPGTGYTDCATFLDSPDSLAGGLIIRDPDGVAQFHVDSSGNVRTRFKYREHWSQDD